MPVGATMKKSERVGKSGHIFRYFLGQRPEETPKHNSVLQHQTKPKRYRHVFRCLNKPEDVAVCNWQGLDTQMTVKTMIKRSERVSKF